MHLNGASDLLFLSVAPNGVKSQGLLIITMVVKPMCVIRMLKTQYLSEFKVK